MGVERLQGDESGLEAGPLAAPFGNVCVTELKLLPKWLPPGMKPVSANTRKSYNTHLRYFNRWNAGEPITPARVLQFFEHIAAQDAVSTRHVRKAAVRFGLILTFCAGDTPTALEAVEQFLRMVRLPSTRQSIIGSLIPTVDELTTMVDQAEDAGRPRLALFIEALLSSGFRISELCGIRLRDVQQIVDGWAIVTVTGKGNKERTITAFPAELYARIREEFQASAPQHFLFRTQHPLSKSGGYSRRYVYRELRAWAEQTIGRRITPHAIRHRHATDLYDAGMPLNVVANRLGHADPGMTARVYAHSSERKEILELVRIRNRDSRRSA